MFSELTGTLTYNLLQKSLDVSAMRNKAIAQNIANINTPGYKRKVVSFEEEMSRVLEKQADLVGARTDDRHIPIEETSYMDVEPRITTDRAHIMRNDKNNVDIDVEMSDLSKNSMMYQVNATRLTALLNDLNNVISKGAR
ncbi:MAG: flagellar basal body rod protein FlgB [Candidatus Riflebacteria bacterium]|nr:flagellar basal body rod protein FlgB [Candidatus Riflebacteria bacterium]